MKITKKKHVTTENMADFSQKIQKRGCFHENRAGKNRDEKTAAEKKAAAAKERKRINSEISDWQAGEQELHRGWGSDRSCRSWRI